MTALFRIVATNTIALEQFSAELFDESFNRLTDGAAAPLAGAARRPALDDMPFVYYISSIRFWRSHANARSRSNAVILPS